MNETTLRRRRRAGARATFAALMVFVAASCGSADSAEDSSKVQSVSEDTVQGDNGRPMSVWSPDDGEG